jgi:7-cyano-7-deazaguanine synthase
MSTFGQSAEYSLEYQLGMNACITRTQARELVKRARKAFGMPDSVAIVSGGMDSVVMLHRMVSEGRQPLVLSFNYGQRHVKELVFAQYHADILGLTHYVVDLSSITALISNSALTSQAPTTREGVMVSARAGRNPLEREIEVPEGHYAEDNMSLTVVPKRNMMMLSIAAAACINIKGHLLGVGIHAGDHPVYPDCRPQFIEDVQTAIETGMAGFVQPDFKIFAPWLEIEKYQIVKWGNELGVNFSQTWSCYVGSVKHCGKCGTCVERAEAFWLAEVEDPTIYADANYWRSVSKVYQENKDNG